MSLVAAGMESLRKKGRAGMYRQGDVIVLSAVPLPENAVMRATSVVAEGEATGHAHRLTNGSVFDVGDGGIVIAVRQDGALTHEEHQRVAIAPSPDGMVYPVIIQREYSDENEWTKVVD